MSKDFLNYEQQIDLLKKKKLIIPDEEVAKSVLKRTSYFALINGYKKVFKSDDGNYLPTATFDHIVALYDFDVQLSDLFIKYILIFEREIKSHISYYFSNEYPNSYHDYTNVNNYNYADENNRIGILELVSILNSLRLGKKPEYISHYHKKHKGEIPLWVLIKNMSFGQISKMYAFLTQKLQVQIANEFEVSNKELCCILSFMTYFRNVCAHNERLYNFHTREELPETLYTSLEIPNNLTEPRNNLFSVVVCFYHILSETNFGVFLAELTDIIDAFSLGDCEVNKEQILKTMGFPNEWESLFSQEVKQEATNTN